MPVVYTNENLISSHFIAQSALLATLKNGTVELYERQLKHLRSLRAELDKRKIKYVCRLDAE